MPRRTLIDFFDDLAVLDGEFLVYDDGYRTWSLSYRDAAEAARAFAGRLRAAGIVKGQAVAIWSENRPEWIVALWGCLLEGVVLVPIDYRASAAFLLRVADIVWRARSSSATSSTPADVQSPERAVWPLTDLRSTGSSAKRFGVAGAHRLRSLTPTTPPRSSSRPARRPIPRASSSPTGTSSPTSFPSRKRSRNTGSGRSRSCRSGFSICCRSATCSARRWERSCRRCCRASCCSRAATPPTTSSGRFEPAASRCSCACRRSSRCSRITSCASPRRQRLRPRRCTGWRAGGNTARVHRLFGFKFWAIVVGAAPLDPELEAFWGRLGFVVVQGYGLTETAPIVTLNHPFHAAQGRGRQADRRRRGADCRRRRNPRARRERDARLLQRARGNAHGVPGRLVPHRRRRRDRRQRTAAHPRPQEGDDRHARRASTSFPKTSSRR